MRVPSWLIKIIELLANAKRVLPRRKRKNPFQPDKK